MLLRQFFGQLGLRINHPAQARKAVNYAESDEDEDDTFGPIVNNSRGRAVKRQRVAIEEDSDDEFALDAATQDAMLDEGEFSTRYKLLFLELESLSLSFIGLLTSTQTWTTSLHQMIQMKNPCRESASDRHQRNREARMGHLLPRH